MLRLVEAGNVHAPPVLFIHGWWCSAYVFRKSLSVVAAAGYRAMAVDLPGHGLSDKPSDPSAYTRDALCTTVSSLLDVLAIQRVHVVGHSMGGAIATSLALKDPDRVRSLALLAPVGFGDVRGISIARRLTPRAVLPVLPLVQRRTFVAAGLRGISGPGAYYTPAEVDEYWAPTQFPEFARAMRELLHRFDWGCFGASDIAGLKPRTLVAVGTRDPMVVARPELASLMASLAAGVLLRLTDAGHVLPEERPESVNRSMLECFAAASTSN